MKNRLEMARDLLSEDGVIFVQCDDNEQAYLKVLMDEIFGRGNFVNNVIWQKKFSPQNDAGILIMTNIFMHPYCHWCYSNLNIC
jgi:adenine-specific DNA-methyltransferase